jgi:membrane-bound serine protease (ClpP class)
MEILLNPNIAYVIIVIACLLAFICIIIPGSGLPETGLLLCIGLSWYEISHFPPNLWSLLPISLSLIPFLGALRFTRMRLPLLIISILLLTGGSAFLFLENNGQPSVNPILAGFVSLLSAGFGWFSLERGLLIQTKRPVNDIDAVIGQAGQTRTKVHKNGSVQVAGELWSACSEQPIPAGCQVIVRQRQGFTLIVEKLPETT